MSSKRKITRELRALGLLDADEILRELFAHGGPMRATNERRSGPVRAEGVTIACRNSLPSRKRPGKLTCDDCGRQLKAPRCNCED